jgi:hypothetical protein
MRVLKNEAGNLEWDGRRGVPAQRKCQFRRKLRDEHEKQSEIRSWLVP